MSGQEIAPEVVERPLRSLYSPEKGLIACVLLQAAFKGDREPCHFFGAGDWEVSFPDETFGWVELPREAWRRLGMMTREQRIAAVRAARELAPAA
jgi:hypothetical protein